MIRARQALMVGLACLVVTLSPSCKKWLDVPVEGAPNTGNYWKTESDFSQALDACYTPFGAEEAYGRDQFAEQVAGDDFVSKKSDWDPFANLSMNGETEESMNTLYELYTQMLQQANRIVYYALKVDKPSPRMRMHTGEAYFCRGFAHFQLAYRFGRADQGFPFCRYEEFPELQDMRIPPQLASVCDNYAAICQDMDKAIALLPPFKEYEEKDYGRATRDAAIALKVKTLAYWAQHDPSKWAQIPQLVDRLEKECGRALLPSFADVFKTENEWGPEFIFSCNNDVSMRSGSFIAGIFLEEKAWGIYNGWGTLQPTLELFAEYKQGDERRGLTLFQYNDPFKFFGYERHFYSVSKVETGFMLAKYMQSFQSGERRQTGVDSEGKPVYSYWSNDVSNDGNRPLSNLNIPVFRHAEMVLFKAEALIEMGQGAEAAKELNRLTSRAGLGTPYTTATMRDLMHERRCELAGEFTNRFMDLKRWAPRYPEALEKLQAAKHGIKHLERSNPASAVDNVKGTDCTINGVTYQGTVQIWKAKTYKPDVHCVFPYPRQEIVKARGAIRQNPGY